MVMSEKLQKENRILDLAEQIFVKKVAATNISRTTSQIQQDSYALAKSFIEFRDLNISELLSEE